MFIIIESAKYLLFIFQLVHLPFCKKKKKKKKKKVGKND